MIKIFQVDAFTTEKYRGNPAMICLLDRLADNHWMQAVAAEMNLSETAFVAPSDDGFELRWFTPTVEVELCGHATLAAAHILFETGIIKEGKQVRFFTRSGLLTVTQHDQLLEMRFPVEKAEPVPLPPILERILGVRPVFVGKNRFDLLVHVPNQEDITQFVPDYYELTQIPVRGIILTSKSDDERYDFISRFFAPRVGINEDPVTGSAHSCLAHYWASLLGKNQLCAYQASARGGEIRMRMTDGYVILGGYAVTVLKGELL
ncbi:MAG: PhzF family phenazine biosynthesis protein [Calditrichaeota bacterium]|nr:MAG: PhzF family phenazine biosynthesis protein [Calditrichota bacterium]